MGKLHQNVKKNINKGPALESHQILLRPTVTEKAMFQSTELNQYTFRVNPLATKTQIKSAVEKLFEVKVTGVSTQNCKGKAKRHRYTYGRTKDWKKAIVTLDVDSKIDFF